MTSVAGPARSDLPDDATSRRQLDEEAAPFSALASTLAGDALTLVDRLEQLEQGMRDRYRLAANGPVGSNVGLLHYALENSGSGTPEQFVAAFVLMARSFGATARIAIGYSVPDDGTRVTSAQALAWPEVYFEDVGWVTYDPVPVTVSDEDAGGQQQVEARPSELAPQPPVNPPAEDEPPPDPASPASTSGSPVATTVVVAAASVGALVFVASLLAALVVLVKARRRRRRLAAGPPARQVLGAWAEATDHLVELGAQLFPHQTNGEMVVAGASLLSPRARRPLTDLATLANTAAHGKEAPDRIVAAHAVRLLGQVEQIMGEGHSRFRRLRRRLSTRSLRRRTRSPAR